MEELRHGRIVTEVLAHVSEDVDFSGTKDETSAQLKWILSQLVLMMTSRFSAFPRGKRFALDQSKKASLLELGGSVGLSVGVDQQRKGDAGLCAELPRVLIVAKSDCRNVRAFPPKIIFVSAQLRDVLAAEYSTVVTQECDNTGFLRPK